MLLERTCVGLDVHARSVVACAIDGEVGEIRTLRVSPKTDAVVAWVVSLPGPVAVVYEAGPTGFGLARALAAVGVRCVVVAPSKLERPPGDRVKTDRREAVRATREDDPQRPARLSNLGGAAVLFFNRIGQVTALDIAEEALAEALRTPHRHRTSHLSNLGTVHQRRFTVTRDVADADAAIAAYREAESLAPDGDPILPSLLSNLGNVHLRRHQLTGDPRDLAHARARLAEAVARTPARTPAGHPTCAPT